MTMKKIFYNLVLFAGVSFTGAAVLSSCTKGDDNSATNASSQQYFSTNVVNHDFAVLMATDNGTDITANYNGINFRFADTATLAGTATASNSLLTVHGTWTVDAAYDKITFSFPTTTLTSLSFMNKQWQFMNRNSQAIDLKAANGETDELHFTRK
jgi:hypothetical protein